MIVAVANIKGGVGKTTTAIHFAAALQQLAPTLLLDGDELTRSASTWEERAKLRGSSLPFRVAYERQGSRIARDYQHVVIDTGQKPSTEELKELSQFCDLIVVPAVPAYLDNDGTALTVNALRSLGVQAYRVLLTKVPPPNETDAAELRADFASDGVPIFAAEVPRLKVFDKAAAAGTTVGDASFFSRHDAPPAARAWAAYQSAVQETINHAR